MWGGNVILQHEMMSLSSSHTMFHCCWFQTASAKLYASCPSRQGPTSLSHHIRLMLASDSVAAVAASGLDAVGQLTGLTSLHLAHKNDGCWHDDRRITAPGGSLSGLTRLCALRCHAGRYKDSNGLQQSQDWGSTLSCMPHLTRLELINVEAHDAVLLAIGSNAPHLQRLVFECREAFMNAGTSAAGADAIRHVGHIELLWDKWMDCEPYRELVRLPGIKRVDNHWPGYAESEGWSPETCPCCRCSHK